MTVTIKDPVNFLPVFAVETLPQESVASVSDETRLTDLLFEKRTHDAGYDNFQITVVPANFGDTWTLTNETPEVCGLSAGGLATQLDDGAAVIHLDSGEHRQRINLTFASDESITYVWKGFTGTSVASVLSNTMRDMAGVGGDLEYYSGFTNGNTAATVNGDRWFTPDLSASAIATNIAGSWSTANSGVLIAPRVFLGVRHWDNNYPTTNLAAGTQLKFVSADGVVNTRAVLSRFHPIGYDVYVCILSDDHDEDILPMKIAGNWFEESLNATQSRLCGMGWQLHQDKRVTLCVFDAVMYGGVFPTSNATTGIVNYFSWLNEPAFFSDSVSWMYGYDSFFTEGIVGDSGGAIGTVVDDEAVLVSLFTSPQAGHLYYEGIEDEMNDWIQSAADLAGVVITDEVTIAPSPLA